MHSLKSAVLFVAAMVGVVTSTLGGTLGAFTIYPANPPVAALSDPVTYSKAADGLTTYAAFKVGDLATGLLLQNTSGNTLNKVTITFTATVKDNSETLAFHQPDVYLAKLVGDFGCIPGGPNVYTRTITCNVGQMKTGATFPSFTVFFLTPQKGTGTGVDNISASLRIDYAENINGANPSPNSTFITPAVSAALGTDNPIDIKSAVPQSGVKLSSGKGGVPTSGNKLTELVEVPALPSGPTSTTAIVNVSFVASSDSTAGANCLTQGHFLQCPTYTTLIPGTFAASPFLKTIYRVDATNLKMSSAKILNSVQISYLPDGASVFVPVVACTNDTITGTGVPCLLPSETLCFKRSSPGWTLELDGDCQWTVINSKNGSLKLE